MKYCKNCIWFEQCAQDCACEDYDPISLEESEANEVGEFNADLEERHTLYNEQIEEQNQ